MCICACFLVLFVGRIARSDNNSSGRVNAGVFLVVQSAYDYVRNSNFYFSPTDRNEKVCVVPLSLPLPISVTCNGWSKAQAT